MPQSPFRPGEKSGEKSGDISGAQSGDQSLEAAAPHEPLQPEPLERPADEGLFGKPTLFADGADLQTTEDQFIINNEGALVQEQFNIVDDEQSVVDQDPGSLHAAPAPLAPVSRPVPPKVTTPQPGAGPYLNRSVKRANPESGNLAGEPEQRAKPQLARQLPRPTRYKAPKPTLPSQRNSAAGHQARQQTRSSPASTPTADFEPNPSKLPPINASGILEADEDNLVAAGLAKSFGRRQILRDVNLGVRRGEVVGLLGPNGAGKTTCFYIVCGLLGSDGGKVHLGGRNVTRMPVYRRARYGLGYLPQEASIFRGLTVEKNIMAILQACVPRARDRYDRLEQLLEEFSISHLRRSPALALSGGERRRVEIARALAADPEFILLDEPFAGVDPIAVGDIRKLVSQLKNRGIGVLITDHNVRDTLSVVDRAYIIYQGEVLRHGIPSEIVADSRVRDVYLGSQFQL